MYRGPKLGINVHRWRRRPGTCRDKSVLNLNGGRHMATKKSSKKGNVKVGKLNVKTTKVKANELKKVKGGEEPVHNYSFKQAWPTKYTG